MDGRTALPTMRSGLVHNDGYGGEQNHRLPKAQVGSRSCTDTVASEVKATAMSKVGVWALCGLRVRDTELWGRQEVASVIWKPSRTQ